MELKYYSVDNHCDAKAISSFWASEDRFDSLEECCQTKFPQSVSDCCNAGENGCSLSGNHKYIPVSETHYFKLTAGWILALISFSFQFIELERSDMLHQRRELAGKLGKSICEN